MIRPLLMILLLGVGCATPRWHTVQRISPAIAQERLRAQQALLVCAYEKSKCLSIHLAGGIPLEELEGRLAALPKDQELIFFCG